jgi:transcriptional regulator GlxA family with amidase domain
LREPNGVDVLAQVAGMSPRSFARAFKRETNVTPAEFVESARVDAARNRLEGSDLPLKVVAHECGFSSAEHMRVVFVKRLGITPSHYRASFRKV